MISPWVRSATSSGTVAGEIDRINTYCFYRAGFEQEIYRIAFTAGGGAYVIRSFASTVTVIQTTRRSPV